MFASWGAEEYGLIGSSEWVEEHLTLLQASSIAYVNCDVGISGNWSFYPKGTPNMQQLVHEVAKLVDNPRRHVDGDEIDTIFKNMVLRLADGDESKLEFISVAANSDFAPFLQRVGTSAIDIRWTFPPDVPHSYPVYHSVYETMELVEDFVDPDFTIHRETAMICAICKFLIKIYPFDSYNIAHGTIL